MTILKPIETMSKERIRIAGERLEDRVNLLANIQCGLSVVSKALEKKGALEADTIVGQPSGKTFSQYLSGLQKDTTEVVKILEQVAFILSHWKD